MIFCVDDDNTIRDIEVYTLESVGFKAKGFINGYTLLEAMKSETPQLIILDIMLPGEDGIEILKRIKANPETRKIPIIMATAKGTEIDKITGLDSGADDYLVKPFGVMEMVSRVKAVLRRCEPKEKQVLAKDDITLSENERTVTVAGSKIPLTYKEFELLRLFLKNQGTVFSREDLLSQIWGVDYLGESRTVDMHIKTLRHKLGNSGKLIETVIGVGYRLGENK